MKNMVLAYDGSAAAKRALERAAELADGAVVTVVTAVEVAARVGRAGAFTDPDEIAERRRELDEAAGFLRGKGLEPQTIEVHGLDVAGAIVEEARNTGADLVIVGSTGKNLAERLLLGSVSTKVLHDAPCDVLVVR